MSNIALLPPSGYTNSNEDVAIFLRDIADKVASGSLGSIRQCLIMLEAGGKVNTWVAGGPCDIARALGVIEVGKSQFMSGAGGEA